MEDEVPDKVKQQLKVAYQNEKIEEQEEVDKKKQNTTRNGKKFRVQQYHP